MSKSNDTSSAGTTLVVYAIIVAVFAISDRWHIGDTAVYRPTGEEVECLSTDIRTFVPSVYVVRRKDGTTMAAVATDLRW